MGSSMHAVDGRVAQSLPWVSRNCYYLLSHSQSIPTHPRCKVELLQGADEDVCRPQEQYQFPPKRIGTTINKGSSNGYHYQTDRRICHRQTVTATSSPPILLSEYKNTQNEPICTGGTLKKSESTQNEPISAPSTHTEGLSNYGSGSFSKSLLERGFRGVLLGVSCEPMGSQRALSKPPARKIAEGRVSTGLPPHLPIHFLGVAVGHARDVVGRDDLDAFTIKHLLKARRHK